MGDSKRPRTRMEGAAGPLWFRPSQIASTTRVFAQCKRCLSSRDLIVPELPDVALIEIEKRLRCTDRGRDGRGPPCGSGGTIELYSPPVTDSAGLLAFPGPLR